MLRLLAVCIGVHLALAAPSGVNDTARRPALTLAEFPYQVLISQYEDAPRCGGVLVANNFIITSATCVLEFGGIKRFLEDAILYGGGTSLLVDLGDVADAAIHPKYMMNPTSFDVAVVKYIPDEKGPRLNATTLNETWTADTADSCVLSSWWSAGLAWPERLVWQPVSVARCSMEEPNLFCFDDDTTLFKEDYGSPIVCGGVLTGLVPHGGGPHAINLTADHDWITVTMAELDKSVEPDPSGDEDTRLFLARILQRLDALAAAKPTPGIEDHLASWNNQIVVPLSYVMFAMVVFFFVLLFFIVLFTVVLVYYSRK